MKPVHIRISGGKPRIGFDLSHPVVSWRGTPHPCRARIEVSLDPAFRDLVSVREGDLSPLGEPLGFSPAPRTVYYLRGLSLDGEEPDRVSETVTFESGKRDEPYTGSWIAPEAGDGCHPTFFRRFRVEKPLVRARAYVTAGGVYEAYLDGEKLGEECLAPYFTDSRYALQVNTYPLSLSAGEHTFSVTVGPGWYRGRFGLEGEENLFGDRSALLAEVHFDYEDGSHEMFVTDETWEYVPSDIVFSGIYDGEDIDRTRYASLRPRHPVAVLPDGGNLVREHLTDRYSPPLTVYLTLPVQKLLHTPAGETVLDFGQNFAGFVSFHNRLPRGRTVTLDFGEVLQGGNFYRENYRTARARFTYTSGGEPETVRPHFTYFGFRYVRVRGWDDCRPEDFLGCALSSEMEDTLVCKTGNKDIDRLLQNCRFGMRSNFMDLPTDCPQRDERLAWTGDAQVFAPTACFFADTRAFYDKFLRELRATQQSLDGAVPNYLPALGFLGDACAVWGDAATFLPHTLFWQYGDREALRRHYPLMRDWVDYVRRRDDESGGERLFPPGFQFGDWLALDGVTETSMKGGTDDRYIASLYYFRSARMTSEAAEALGLSSDAARFSALSEEVRRAILREYFTPAGALAVPTQTGYLLALRFGVAPDRARLIRDLCERLRKDRFRLRAGFVGAPVLCSTLADAGLTRLAYRFLFREDYPSWLFCVHLGATTIWERWNSLLPDGTVSDTGMNSFNHYAYGAVAEFLFSYAAGLRPLSPGFTRVRIAPCPDYRLRSLAFTYRSAAGDYTVRWEILPTGEIDLFVSVPLGCEAELVLPGMAGEVRPLGAGTLRLVYRPEQDFLRLFYPDSPLDEVARDPHALKILREKVPAFAAMAEGGPEAGAITLSMLPGMTYIPHDGAALSEALAAIYALRAETEGST